jgi:hypothetical protein
VVYCGNVLEDINYFRKMIELICDSGSNSTNVGKLIEALYKNNRNYFMTTIKELNQEKQKKILLFLDNNNSNTNNNCNDKNMNSNVSNNSSGKIKRIVNKYNNNNSTDNNSSPYDGIKIYIYNGNIKAFIEILENNKNYMPNCFMLLTEEKNIKFIGNLLNFIFTIIALKTNLCKEINQNMEILISQLVKCFLQQLDNSSMTDIIKEILNILPQRTNSDKYYKIISKYLNIKNNEILLENLLICIKNNISNEKAENLENKLPLFIQSIFNMLNHDMSEIRKLSVYCILEIYKIIGNKFDIYIELLPKNQQNLIYNFIKKEG